MKYITCIVILILQLSAFAEDKSDLHWTQKIFIKEKKNLELRENENYNCKKISKVNDPNIKSQKKLPKNECNEKKK